MQICIRPAVFVLFCFVMEILDRLSIYLHFFKIVWHVASDERMIKNDDLERAKKKDVGWKDE